MGAFGHLGAYHFRPETYDLAASHFFCHAERPDTPIQRELQQFRLTQDTLPTDWVKSL